MYGDNGVIVDLREIGKAIATAEIFALGFPHFPERLLVDARVNEKESPLIQVVEPAASAPERLRWLQRRRPSLGLPQSLTFFMWPQSATFLLESGVWDEIRQRLGAHIDSALELQCAMALRQIQNLELSASQALLRGDGCFTLWPRGEVKEGRI